MVSMPKGPKAWKVESLRPCCARIWMLGCTPVEGITHEAELREEFLDWASKRPLNLREIRDGHSLFRIFVKEFMNTPEGRLRVLQINKRRYQLAYDEDYKFPGWSREKSLQMLRNIDREIEEAKGRMSRSFPVPNPENDH